MSGWVMSEIAKARRRLYLWELSVAQRRIGLILLACVLLAIVYAVVVAMLPHHVLNTMLRYEEKSNGVREYFDRGVREVPR